MEPIDRVELNEFIQPNGYLDQLNHSGGDKLLYSNGNDHGNGLQQNGIGMCYHQPTTGSEPRFTCYHLRQRYSDPWRGSGTGQYI